LQPTIDRCDSDSPLHFEPGILKLDRSFHRRYYEGALPSAGTTLLFNEKVYTMKNTFKYVLTLNRAWIPIDIVSFQDAFRLMAKEHAKAIDTQNDFATYTLMQWIDLHNTDSKYDHHVNTIQWKIPIPEIIVLQHFDKIPRRLITFSKENLLIRDDFRCAYCGCDLNMQTMTIDHVVPRMKGGKTTWQNCVSSCKKCNHEKRHYDPVGQYAPMVKLHEPNHHSLIYRLHKKLHNISYPAIWEKFLMKG